MTVAARKQAERARRKERGEVALSGWLSASDHEALSAMAREAGMTQAQVVARLIGMVGAVRELERYESGSDWQGDGMTACPDGSYVRHSDLTAAVGLGK
jgi:hypothetical protein